MSVVVPKAPQGAAATETAVRQYLKELEKFIEAEVQRVDERIAASRKARGGPEYNPIQELEVLRPTLDTSAYKLPKLVLQGGGSGAQPAVGGSSAASDPEEDAKRASDAAEKKKLQEEESARKKAAYDAVQAEAAKKLKQEQEEQQKAASSSSGGGGESGGGKVDAKELVYQAMTGSKQKAGMLTNWGKKSMFRSFNDTYVVVNDQGVSWYKSERDVKSGKPVETVPFYVLTTNSRGSRFKNAAVCWPLITTQECPKATDKNKTYFGVQYTDASKKDNSMEFLVFGASSPEERDQWVFFITKYIKLYLGPSQEFLQFEHMRVGAEKPLHQHGVIDGEAPR